MSKWKSNDGTTYTLLVDVACQVSIPEETLRSWVFWEQGKPHGQRCPFLDPDQPFLWDKNSAGRYGVSLRQCQQIARKRDKAIQAGWSGRGDPTPWMSTTKKQIASLIEDGLSSTAIARRLEKNGRISASFIKAFARRNGLRFGYSGEQDRRKAKILTAIEDADGQKSAAEIAADIDCCRKAVSRVARSAGIDLRKPKRQGPLSAEERRKVADLLRHGKSRVEILEEIGCGYETINRIAVKHKLKPADGRAKKRDSDFKACEARRWVIDNRTYVLVVDAAKLTGISRPVIRGWVNHATGEGSRAWPCPLLGGGKLRCQKVMPDVDVRIKRAVNGMWAVDLGQLWKIADLWRRATDAGWIGRGNPVPVLEAAGIDWRAEMAKAEPPPPAGSNGSGRAAESSTTPPDNPPADDLDAIVRQALQAHGIDPSHADELSPAQRRNIVIFHWSSEPLKDAAIRDRWRERGHTPELRSGSADSVRRDVKEYRKRGAELIGQLQEI